MSILNQIKLNYQVQISVDGGDIWHALKSTDDSFSGFGEAYFSWIKPGAIKAWKRHLQMKMNLIVPIGMINFVFFDSTTNTYRQECIGISSYARLTVPPGIWFGFQGISENSSLLLNIANIPHDPYEIERKTLNEIQFNWQKLT